MISFHDIAKGSDYMIKFLHVATGHQVEFPAFLTEFSDKYTVSWGSEQVYGRMDPIKPYQGTQRSISVGFDVLSPNLEAAKINMSNYSRLIQMLYPVYSEPLARGTGRGRTLRAPPLMRIRFANLITNVSDFSEESGLLGCIGGLDFTPNKEAGYFLQNKEILPKHFSVSITFDPQHEQELGFDGRKFMTRNFPYGQPETASDVGNAVSSAISEVAASRDQEIIGGSND